MIDFDNDYLGLPLVPFVVELPDRCFLVKLSLSRAQQEEYLSHFDLVEVTAKDHKSEHHVKKPIGHKAQTFLATCSTFILIADDGYQLTSEKEDWHFERWEAEEYPCFSLDEEPVDDTEAYDIYQEYIDKKMSRRLNHIAELLSAGKISIGCIPKGAIDYYQNAKILYKGFDKPAFTKAIVNAALMGASKKEKRHRVRVKDVDLLVSYCFIIKNNPLVTQESAREKAIKLKYPDIYDDELKSKSESLRKLISAHSKDVELNFLFPSEEK